ncbi:TonB-dependent receptor [Novosphingobium piscinae]|uniref:TonB-dependent receptor n=1 Tax=Novosphingobium piscinae TaxID=1507448 RepID=A0A7X1FYV8_9SPHN|nr:TonB-dependent receptor [Novosphingobium piscinae]MBC2669530.1 TonB-dependent receptor [Novosphingobium piscinae]
MKFTNQRARSSVLFAGASLAALLAAQPAVAAEAPEQPATPQASDSADQGSADAIVVTARRKAEKLADVPVSVAALGAGELTERRIFSESDLQTATPGLTVRQTNSSNQISFSLRGQSLDAFSFASPAVLNYINEFNAQSTSSSAFYDLQSIQVLKGPQGTLFGRNATGGAVLYETRKPDANFGGYARLSYGNYNNVVAEGAINVPGEVISGRVAAQYQKRDGYQRNLLLGTRNASIDNFSVRPTIQIKSGGFTNTTVYQYAFTGGVSAGLRATNYYGVNGSSGANTDAKNNFVNGQPYAGQLGFGLPSATLYPDGIAPNLEYGAQFAKFGFSGLPSFINAQKNFGFYDIFNNQTGAHQGRQHLLTNTTTYEWDNNLQLKNVFGFNHSKSRDRTDVDGTPFEPLNIGFDGGTSATNFGNPKIGGPGAEGYTYVQRQLSDELQLSGKSGRLTYIGGLYYFEGKDAQRLPLVFAPDYVAALGDNLGSFLREYQVVSKSKAVYAQMTYALSDQLNVTGGARYTWEQTNYTPARRTAGFNPFLDDFNVGQGVGPEELKASKPSWTVSLDYKPTSSLLLYITHRGSWRTGGFNGTATSVNSAGKTVGNRFLPETTYDFEVGAKFNGEIGTMPATLNIAAYDQHISNVIRAVYLGVAAVSGNVEKARVTGLEADASLRVSPWFQIGGTLAYTNARYTKNTAIVGNTVVKFGPYGDVPEWTGSAYAKVEHEIASVGTVSLRGDMYSQSAFYYSNAAATILPGTRIDGYTLFDLRAELSNAFGTGATVSAYVKNLTDKKYNVGGFALGAVNAINSVLPGLPRMYGVEIKYDF